MNVLNYKRIDRIHEISSSREFYAVSLDLESF